ncbi:hypothetical protein N9481_00175 [Pelagibacteraceae bacterium]|jgi:hypothetical protein|nr:hypothetical protein [Pelagibacteraceae bacterium]|tara:strand:- start:226 stop:531 length:306 start_codon:yes stop_codon:yes gene_type:complete
MNYFFLLIIVIIASDAYSKNGPSLSSIDNKNCKIFIKQHDSKIYQTVNCTSKTKYPIPIIGYDKEHCIEYIKRKFGKTLGDKKGLYCSLDGYKFEKWYYVK